MEYAHCPMPMIENDDKMDAQCAIVTVYGWLKINIYDPSKVMTANHFHIMFHCDAHIHFHSGINPSKNRKHFVHTAYTN